MDNTIQYPLYRDELFSKAKRVADYEKLKTLHRSVSWMIGHIGEEMEKWGTPRNRRQQLLQEADIRNLRRLKRQKERIEERMSAMEKVIRLDIDRSKVE